MCITDITARVQQIQSQLAMLAPQPATATTGTTFADQLSASSPTGATTSTATTTPASEDAVVAEARKYLGVPYVWGGTDPQKGLDCSGFVQLVYKNLGYDLPRVSW